MDSAIEKIRANVSLFDVWRDLKLPGTPRLGDQCSPLRDDKRASFTIYQARGHLRWHDHGSVEGGDCIDLWAHAKGISVKEAIAEMNGTAAASAKAPNRPPELVLTPSGIRWPPDLRSPQEDECRALGALRSLSPEAFFLAGRLGTLQVATIYQQKCWIITDRNARCAEARRFDSLPFASGNKGFCLPGSRKDMPIGLKTSNAAFDALDNMLLVEGMPDYYAALHLAVMSEISFRVVAILGASIRTFNDATQQYLSGKKILMTCHNDVAGQAALLKWVKEFYRLGAIKVVSHPLPFLHDDLNDFLQNPGADDPLDLLKGFFHDHSPIRSSPKL
jgi:hypothetical protein